MWRWFRINLKRAFGAVANWLRLPGFVRPIDFDDETTGHRIKIRVTRGYTIVSVDGRDYWFQRLTGKFDGTGSAC